MSRHPLPKVPYIQAKNEGSKQRPTAIVLKLSHTTSDKGAALGFATNLHRNSRVAESYHYVLDEAEVYRGVWDDRASYANPYRSISVMLCAEPVEDVRLWAEGQRPSVLRRAEALVAELILVHKVRPRYLDENAQEHWLRRRHRYRGGLIVDLPGAWPYESFLTNVRAQMALKTS